MKEGWFEENGKHVLYFVPFYKEIIAAVLYREDGAWFYTSEVTGVTDEYVTKDGNLEYAQSVVICYIAGHYANECMYYSDLHDKITGLK